MKSLPLHIKEEIKRKQVKGSQGKFCESTFKKYEKFRDLTGILYYIKFEKDSEVFWKIGITTNSLNKRWGNSFKGYKITHLYKSNVLNLYNCFKVEQRILDKYKEYRIKNNISTEILSRNVINNINEFKETINENKRSI